MPRVMVGSYSRVRRAILDEDVVLPGKQPRGFRSPKRTVRSGA